MADVAFVAIVRGSAITRYPTDRLSKAIWVVPPAVCADRLQSVVTLGLRQLTDPVRAQIDTNSFEFSTRSRSRVNRRPTLLTLTTCSQGSVRSRSRGTYVPQ